MVQIVKIDKRGRLMLAKVLKEIGIKPPVKCVVKTERGTITLKPLPKMAKKEFGYLKPKNLLAMWTK